MAMTGQDFIDGLRTDCADEGRDLVAEHLDYHGDVLLHVLMADVRRMAMAMFERGETEALERVLALVDRSLTDGDGHLENAAAVCFVEDTGWWDPQMSGFIDTWPAGLTAEAEGQRRWRPGTSTT